MAQSFMVWPYLRLEGKLLSLLPYSLNYQFQRLTAFRHQRARFRERNGYPVDLFRPQTINEKILHRKLFSRDPRFPMVADKFRVRAYVAKRLRSTGEELLIPLLQVVDKAQDLDFDALPESFVAKVNFGCAMNLFVRCKARADFEEIRLQLARMMDQQYGNTALIWWTQQIPRKILVEPLLTDANGGLPLDYKFFVFHGKVKLIQVDIDRFGEHRRVMFDDDWIEVPVEYSYPRAKSLPPKPGKLKEMIEIAEALGGEFDFIRVDLYFHAGRIYFGELTMSPMDGGGKIMPRSYDVEWGSFWDYPDPRHRTR